MNFNKFVEWLKANCKQTRSTKTLAGRSEFEAEMSDDRKSLFIKFGEKGNTGFLLFDKVRIVWDRYWALEQNKYKTDHYTDPKWKKTPNRILSAYIAALTRDFENDITSNFPIKINPVSLPIVTNNKKKKEFLKRVVVSSIQNAIQNSLKASLQHNPTYKADIKPYARKPFRIPFVSN